MDDPFGGRSVEVDGESGHNEEHPLSPMSSGSSSSWCSKAAVSAKIPDVYLTLGWYCKKLERKEVIRDPIATPCTAQLEEEEAMIRRCIVDASCQSVCSLTVSHPCLRRGSVLWCGTGLVVPGAGYWCKSRSEEAIENVILTENTSFSTEYIRYHTTVTFFDAGGARSGSTALHTSLSSWLVMPKLAKNQTARPFAMLPEEALPRTASNRSPISESLQLHTDPEPPFTNYMGHAATFYVVQPPGINNGWLVRRVTQLRVLDPPAPPECAPSRPPMSLTLFAEFVTPPKPKQLSEDELPPQMIDYRLDPLETGAGEPPPGSPLVRVDMANGELVFLGVHKGSSSAKDHLEAVALTPRVLTTEFRRLLALRRAGFGNEDTESNYEASAFTAWSLRSEWDRGTRALASVQRMLDAFGAREGRRTLPLDDDVPTNTERFRTQPQGVALLSGIMQAKTGEDWDWREKRQQRVLQEQSLLAAARMASRGAGVEVMQALGGFGLCEAMDDVLRSGRSLDPPRLMLGVCWIIAMLAYANENAARLASLGVVPLLLAQLERFVDSGFENLELQYWGLAALRNLCRHKDSRIAFLRSGGLDVLRLLLFCSNSASLDERLQRAGLVCLLEIAPLRKTHAEELQVRLEHSQTAMAICRVLLVLPNDRSMNALGHLVATRLGLLERVEACKPVIQDLCMSVLYPSKSEEWWRRRWSVRKAIMAQEDLRAEMELEEQWIAEQQRNRPSMA